MNDPRYARLLNLNHKQLYSKSRLSLIVWQRKYALVEHIIVSQSIMLPVGGYPSSFRLPDDSFATCN